MKATHTSIYYLFPSFALPVSSLRWFGKWWYDMGFCSYRTAYRSTRCQGNDLLNPETPGNIAKQGIKAIYNGKIYEKDVPISQTKAYLAHFNGLQTMKFETGKYFLTFGEFNGDDTFDNEKVIIDWNDGTQDVITFSSKLIWKSKNKPVFDRKFCLNGKDNGLQFGGFVIIKEPVITSSTTSDQ